MIKEKGIEKLKNRLRMISDIIEKSDSAVELEVSKSCLIGMNYPLVSLFDPECKEVWEVSDQIEKMIEFINQRKQDIIICNEERMREIEEKIQKGIL